MPRRLALLLAALLAASPAAALTVSAAACNGEEAELIVDRSGAALTVNGAELKLDPAFGYEGLVCVSNDGRTLFGLTQVLLRQEETYFLLDPQSLELHRISYEEAASLGFWGDEDDWDLSFGD